MATLIGTNSRRLALATTKGNDIENEQFVEVNYLDDAGTHEFLEKYGNRVCSAFKRRCEHISPIYNCHGLTFASRRTGIFDNEVLEQILQDDGYVQLRTEQVLPGDVILYFGPENDIEHSGIVIEPPTALNLNVPLVLSKWGRLLEGVHLANRCPYNFSNTRYYRINHGKAPYS